MYTNKFIMLFHLFLYFIFFSFLSFLFIIAIHNYNMVRKFIKLLIFKNPKAFPIKRIFFVLSFPIILKFYEKIKNFKPIFTRKFHALQPTYKILLNISKMIRLFCSLLYLVNSIKNISMKGVKLEFI
jgi:hypothetical protein